MNRKYLKILPYLALNGAVLVAALFKAFQMSIGYYPIVGLTEFTWDYYLAVLTDAKFLNALAYSIYLTLVATLLALIVGLFLSFMLLRSEKNSFIIKKIIKIPISLPHIIVALMMLQILGQPGIISSLFLNLGIIQDVSDFPLLVHDKGGFSIITAFLYKEIPYVAVTVLAILKQINFGYVQVARNLGASDRHIFWEIIFPLVQSTLATLFVIIFSFTFGSYEVPFLLGNRAQETVSIMAYDIFSQPDLLKRPMAMALNMIISLISIGISVLTLAVSHKLPGGRTEIEK